MKEFTEYFKSQWIDNQFGWFEGYSLVAPSHNNALEASNRVIKDQNTFRERFPIGQFLEYSRELIREWSIKRNEHTPNAKAWVEKPTISLCDWTAAHQWLMQKKDVITIAVNENKKLYFTPAAGKQRLTKTEVKSYIESHTEADWLSFEDF